MLEQSISYQQMFNALLTLGFTDVTGVQEKPVRVFEHEPTETVLIYRDLTTETVSAADMMSTEMRLSARRISERSLIDLVNEAIANSR